MLIPSAQPEIGEAEIAAAVRVLRSGQVGPGHEVAAFEAEFAEGVDGRHCVAVSTGCSALQLSLLALGIGTGDEVIVPAFCSAATANAVRLVGAVPVFADIDPVTFCLDPGAVADAITPFTAAVIPVHLYGHPAAMDQLQAITERRGIALIENADQAHGAMLHGKRVGTFGSVGVFSLGSPRNVHSIDVGIAVTADADLARKLRLLRHQGNDLRSGKLSMGLTDLAAAVAREQIRSLPELVARRRENARVLDSRLRGVTRPFTAAGVVHAYHRYTVRVPGNGRPDRDAFARALAARGIGSEVLYPTPVHRLRAYRYDTHLPETERAAVQALSLPVHSSLSRRQLSRVVSACNALGGLLSV